MFDNCEKMRSYQMSKIYIYGYRNMTDSTLDYYKSAKINNEFWIDEIETDESLTFAVFKVDNDIGGSFSIGKIKNITFLTKPRP